LSQLLIKNGLIADGSRTFQGDILINDEVISEVDSRLNSPRTLVIDASGLIVLPGGVDVHVHLPWPTGAHVSSDNFATGTRAAAFGGVTTVIDFCIPEGDESLTEALERKKDEAKSEAWVDYSFHLNIRGDTAKKVREIPMLIRQGFPSFKVFMAYDGFRLDDSELRLVLEAARASAGLVSVHAEDGPLAERATEKLLMEGKKTINHYPDSRPAECEEEAIRRLLAFQEQTGARVHIHHVSTRDGVEAIAAARREGRPVTGETCPHYLLFTSEDYCGDPQKAAALVCAPSIKSAGHQEALWQALEEGTLTVLATDHCPYTRSQKESDLSDFTKVPGGMGGVELRLPLIYSAGVATGRLSFNRFSQIWAEGPARAFGLYPRKGTITPGSDADLVLFDPSQVWKIKASDLHMNTDCLPYEGMEVNGKVRTVILRGRVVTNEGKLQAFSNGKLIPRQISD
jgi:dihydropyrimidinase